MSEVKNDLQKYGKWVGFMLIFMMIIKPALSLWSISGNGDVKIGETTLFAIVPGLDKVVMVDTIVSVILMLTAFAAGFLLWRKKSMGLLAAKGYFVLALVLAVFIYMMPSMFIEWDPAKAGLLVTAAYGSIKTSYMFGLILTVITSGGFLTTLFLSKSIKANYSKA